MTLHLVGRDDELNVLEDMIAHVHEGGDALVMLGEAGIGKSAVLQAITRRARDLGFRVLETAGVQSESALPFAGLHKLLRSVVDMVSELPATQAGALLAAFGVDDGQPPEPFLISLAVLNLLALVATKTPVLVTVDDAHWLDQPTHDTLAFVARRVTSDPIALISTVRTGYGGPLTTAGLRELEVLAVDNEAARTILAANGNDLSQPIREQILRTANGNPLALVELPTAWRQAFISPLDQSVSNLPLTARLERAFADRVVELSAPERDAILIAAVDPSDAVPEILAAAAHLSRTSAGVDVLDRAVAVGLIQTDGMRLSFRHPLVRSAVLKSESLARQHSAHAALADVLHDDPYRRTWHRAQAIVGTDDEVADELEAAHLTSIRRGAVASAVWSLERSAQLTTDPAQRGRRLLLAAEQAFGLGRVDMVSRLLQAAANTPLSRLDRARMEWLREIFNDGVPGDAGRVMELCDIAEHAIAAQEVDLALNLLLGAALRCWWADTGPGAPARVAAVTEQIDGMSHDARYVAALAVAQPIERGGRVTELLDAVTLESVTDADTLRLLGMASHAIGDPVRAVDFLDRAEARFRDQGRLGLLPHVLGILIPSRNELGEWERARAAADEGRRLAEETGQPVWRTGLLTCDARTSALRGEFDHAMALAADAEAAANRQRLNDLLACVELARGFAWASAARYEEAYVALLPMFDPGEPSFHQREQFAAIMVLAEAAVRSGHGDEARQVMAEMERVALVTPAPILHVQLAYARAVLAADEDAEHLYRVALAADLTRWPWVKARLNLAFGAWLRRQRRVAESARPLRAAQTTFELIGARGWAAQANTELRAAGVGTSPHRGGGASVELSAQETQIAQLAAEGLSNREIGERLFLSSRTVGSHLYRIFPKLNVTSRSQLASRLRGST